jgi:hypothetical protein
VIVCDWILMWKEHKREREVTVTNFLSADL